MSSPTHQAAFASFPGLASWARAVDIKFHATGEPTPGALDLLPGAYAHVSQASPLGRWMHFVSTKLDGSITYDATELCRLAYASQIPFNSPFGVWMREVTAKVFVS
jgi:hypothetical protein